MEFFRTLFSKIGLLILIYLLIGVFVNTAAPHIPPGVQSAGSAVAWLHSWIQYFVSILTWPLSFWHPHFTTGRWHR